MLILLILIALLQPAVSLAQSASLSVDAGAGARIVEVDRGRGNAVFSLAALQPLGASLSADATTARLTIFDQTITFSSGSPFFRKGSEQFQLVAPARFANNQVMVSPQFLTEWLPRAFPEKLTLDKGTLRLKSAAAANAPSPSPAVRPDSPTPTPTRPPAPELSRAAVKNRVVVIDAGHGGRDPGKVGPNGLREKTVTLTVAGKLAALLRDKGYEVHLTRSTDTLIALADRPKLANQWKNNRPATLFVSVHANAGVASAEGYETYFLSEARTEDERRVAEMENAAVAYEEKTVAKGPAIDLLLNGLRNDYYQRASNDFAEVIQRELGAFHPGKNRGVKQAGFRVLVGALMPAVLVEIAFISNPNESKLLGATSFQDKIAYGLARSIHNFFDTHEHLFTESDVQP
jgi:N-acetylmuramoyl-L-alanine amidase